jgi:hypothetical protein
MRVSFARGSATLAVDPDTSFTRSRKASKPSFGRSSLVEMPFGRADFHGWPTERDTAEVTV